MAAELKPRLYFGELTKEDCYPYCMFESECGLIIEDADNDKQDYNQVVILREDIPEIIKFLKRVYNGK